MAISLSRAARLAYEVRPALGRKAFLVSCHCLPVRGKSVLGRREKKSLSAGVVVMVVIRMRHTIFLHARNLQALGGLGLRSQGGGHDGEDGGSGVIEAGSVQCDTRAQSRAGIRGEGRRWCRDNYKEQEKVARVDVTNEEGAIVRPKTWQRRGPMWRWLMRV